MELSSRVPDTSTDILLCVVRSIPHAFNVYPPSLPVDVLISIVQQSDWETLAAWRGTCRTFFAVVAKHLRHRYIAYVKPFVSDVSAFDDLLRKTGSIISGPTALHFFLPDSSWSPSQLDIYVPANMYRCFLHTIIRPSGLGWKRAVRLQNKDATSVSIYPDRLNDDQLSDDANSIHTNQPLPQQSVTGVSHDTTNDHSPDSQPRNPAAEDEDDVDDDDEEDQSLRINIPVNENDRAGLYAQLERASPPRPTVLWCHRYRTARTFKTRTGRRVNVVSSPSNNPITPIRSFWSSLMMNFITPDACVCGFPSATLHRLGTIPVQEPNLQQTIFLQQFRERGFNFDGEPLRRALDLWDYIFFGQLHLLAMDFRETFYAPRPLLPIRDTLRGWLADQRWRHKHTCESIHQFPDYIAF